VSGIDYEKAKALAASADAVERLKLATRADTQPEILYYLAIDQAEEVRRAIADNEATPAQAHLLLANDESEEVRHRLAAKVARLLPDLPEDEAGKARELAIQTLELLAQDELARIRAALAEALKSAVNVPHHLVKQLALDVEVIVSAPVLQFSPLLTDDDPARDRLQLGSFRCLIGDCPSRRAFFRRLGCDCPDARCLGGGGFAGQ
jgi:uncharacterized protein (DUF2336 family)